MYNVLTTNKMKNRPIEFYTGNRVNVTKRIEKGITFAFTINEKQRALKKANQVRSYVYDLYQIVEGKLIQYGYAVPK